MPLSFMKDTATVLRPAARSSRGSTVPDWGAAQRIELMGVLVTPESTVQDRDGRVSNASDRLRLRAPYDADIRAGDRVEWGGGVYEVDGDVLRVESPTGRISSTRCSLALWRG